MTPGVCQEGSNARRPLIRQLGDTALSVEFGDNIDPKLIARVHAFDAALNQLDLAGVLETVPSYRATTVFFDPLIADVAAIEAAVMRLSSTEGEASPARRLWQVPVTYGGDFGADLNEVAAHAGMKPGDAPRRHVCSDLRGAVSPNRGHAFPNRC